MGGNIYVQYEYDIEAGDYGSTGGDVNIKAYNGNVYLYENYLYAYSPAHELTAWQREHLCQRDGGSGGRLH